MAIISSRNQQGFTIVELVVVIVLLGILSVTILPRFFDIGDYRDRAAYDEVAGAVRYAQKLAVASGCNIQVKIEDDEYQLGRAVPCDDTNNFVDLGKDFPIYQGPDESVSITPADFYFDGMGRSSEQFTTEDGTEIEVGAEEEIEIFGETGYVDAP